MNRNDRVVLPNDTEFESTRKTISNTVIDVNLPSLVRSRFRSLVEHGVTSTVQVDLSGSLFVTSDRDDGARRLEFRDESGGVSGSRHDDDRSGVLFDRGGNGSHGDGLGGGGRADGHRSEFVEEGRVADGGFGE